MVERIKETQEICHDNLNKSYSQETFLNKKVTKRD